MLKRPAPGRRRGQQKTQNIFNTDVDTNLKDKDDIKDIYLEKIDSIKNNEFNLNPSHILDNNRILSPLSPSFFEIEHSDKNNEKKDFQNTLNNKGLNLNNIDTKLENNHEIINNGLNTEFKYKNDTGLKSPGLLEGIMQTLPGNFELDPSDVNKHQSPLDKSYVPNTPLFYSNVVVDLESIDAVPIQPKTPNSLNAVDIDIENDSIHTRFIEQIDSASISRLESVKSAQIQVNYNDPVDDIANSLENVSIEKQILEKDGNKLKFWKKKGRKNKSSMSSGHTDSNISTIDTQIKDSSPVDNKFTITPVSSTKSEIDDSEESNSKRKSLFKNTLFGHKSSTESSTSDLKDNSENEITEKGDAEDKELSDDEHGNPIKTHFKPPQSSLLGIVAEKKNQKVDRGTGPLVRLSTNDKLYQEEKLAKGSYNKADVAERNKKVGALTNQFSPKSPEEYQQAFPLITNTVKGPPKVRKQVSGGLLGGLEKANKEKEIAKKMGYYMPGIGPAFSYQNQVQSPASHSGGFVNQAYHNGMAYDMTDPNIDMLKAQYIEVERERERQRIMERAAEGNQHPSSFLPGQYMGNVMPHERDDIESIATHNIFTNGSSTGAAEYFTTRKVVYEKNLEDSDPSDLSEDSEQAANINIPKEDYSDDNDDKVKEKHKSNYDSDSHDSDSMFYKKKSKSCHSSGTESDTKNKNKNKKLRNPITKEIDLTQFGENSDDEVVDKASASGYIPDFSSKRSSKDRISNFNNINHSINSHEQQLQVQQQQIMMYNYQIQMMVQQQQTFLQLQAQAQQFAISPQQYQDQYNQFFQQQQQASQQTQPSPFQQQLLSPFPMYAPVSGHSGIISGNQVAHNYSFPNIPFSPDITTPNTNQGTVNSPSSYIRTPQTVQFQQQTPSSRQRVDDTLSSSGNNGLLASPNKEIGGFESGSSIKSPNGLSQNGTSSGTNLVKSRWNKRISSPTSNSGTPITDGKGKRMSKGVPVRLKKKVIVEDDNHSDSNSIMNSEVGSDVTNLSKFDDSASVDSTKLDHLVSNRDEYIKSSSLAKPKAGHRNKINGSTKVEPKKGIKVVSIDRNPEPSPSHRGVRPGHSKGTKKDKEKLKNASLSEESEKSEEEHDIAASKPKVRAGRRSAGRK